MSKIAVMMFAILLLAGVVVWAAETAPTISTVNPTGYLFKIFQEGKLTTITFSGPDSTETIVFQRSDIQKTGEEVMIKGRPFIKSGGLIIGEKIFPPDSIGKVELQISKNQTSILFYPKAPTSIKVFHARKTNEIGLIQNVTVTNDQFVRGAVISFWADALIDGEVNEDVISIFGNATIEDNAVVRGNVVAIDGNITVSKKATIYGSIQSSNVKNRYRFDKWQKWYRKGQYFSPIAMLYYNRIDGFAPYFGARFLDEDSVLPTIDIYGGYGFESSRWRYHLGIEQTFMKTTPVTIGGSFYRKLASNDDWIISESENSAFAILAKEDYKDYFEAEGGYGFARFKTFNKLSLEVGIQSEKYKWLDGHRNLWSIFGGSKRFPENFRSVVEPYRGIGIKEIDGVEITSFKTRLDYQPMHSDSLFGSSFWNCWAELELAPESWNDSVNFNKYVIYISRHQALNSQTGLIIRGVYAGSDDKLPLERKFFLGGLGTLYGYSQKEFMGTRYWMGNIEYGIRFPNSDLVGWILYDVGKIAEPPSKLTDAEYKHSIGVGLSFTNNFRLIIAKRLDQSDISPLIYVRLNNFL